tara:strand:+ start:671 stop:808 length:138 start_codon:yes stop_codon:yes gene_type:complete
MKIRNRQRNVPYKLPLKADSTKTYMKFQSKVNWFSWTIRNKFKTV